MRSLVQFILENGEGRYTGLQAHQIAEVLEEHKRLKTYLEIHDDKGLVALGRWNWDDHKTIRMLDLIIRKDSRSLKALKAIIILGKMKNPTVENIVFTRSGKYKNREYRTYRIDNLLKGGLRGRRNNRINKLAADTICR